MKTSFNLFALLGGIPASALLLSCAGHVNHSAKVEPDQANPPGSEKGVSPNGPLPDESNRSHPLVSHAFNRVDPFVGTGGDGHTFPGATMPYGAVQLSPDTQIRHFKKSYPWAAGYRYEDSSIRGFSHTHFSGTGHSDLGDLLLMPTNGALQLQAGSVENPDGGYRSRFTHAREQAQPGYYSVWLEDSQVQVELTSTTRVGMHRYAFANPQQPRVVFDLESSIYNYDGKVLWSRIGVKNSTTIAGQRRTEGWAKDRAVYFAIQFSKPFLSHGFRDDDNKREYKGFTVPERVDPRLQTDHLNLVQATRNLEGKKLKGFFAFDLKKDEPLLIKVGISSVSEAAALKNIEAELPHWDFDKVRLTARSAWQSELSRIKVTADEGTEKMFYSALYHSMIAPNTHMDVDGRYRGPDHDVHQVKEKGMNNYSTFSLWDTYRALHPLLSIIDQKRSAEFVRSMVRSQKQSPHGVLPIWSFHGLETWCMIGYHAVSVIADAVLKGIVAPQDLGETWDAVWASSNYDAYDGLGHYKKLGFVPIDREPEGASKTLEFAYDDWAIAQMAARLGKEKTAHDYLKRAESFSKVFDKEVGFMRARRSDGSWNEPFDPSRAAYGGDFTEGSAWQYSWYVPHDPVALIRLMGGEKTFVEKLDRLFDEQVQDGTYDHVEDISGLIGQYAHGNEPSHHIAYLYAYAGQAWKGQERLQQIMEAMYKPTPDGLSGNDDCGQMSAWYIFTSLGFYPVAPGSLEYVFGRPFVREAEIRLENGKVFHIQTENWSVESKYVKAVRLNGQLLKRAFLRHQEIMVGGSLVYEMSASPNKELWSQPGARPYSMSEKAFVESLPSNASNSPAPNSTEGKLR